eukprot:7325286-Pyramimonas_sp.AAC.1
MIDEAAKRSKTGAIQIFYVGGDHRRWQSESSTFKMNATWDDIATLLRARMNQRAERHKAAGIQPKLMILDGARLHRKVRHTPHNACHFVDQHESYTLDRDGTMVRVQGGEIMADHTMKAAQLAAWLLCQPSGGSAAQRWICEDELRECGFAKTEAAYEEHVPYRTNWCPTENGTPTSILGTLLFANPLTRFP